ESQPQAPGGRPTARGGDRAATEARQNREVGARQQLSAASRAGAAGAPEQPGRGRGRDAEQDVGPDDFSQRGRGHFLSSFLPSFLSCSWSACLYCRLTRISVLTTAPMPNARKRYMSHGPVLYRLSSQ